jgi:hypothetical protein
VHDAAPFVTEAVQTLPQVPQFVTDVDVSTHPELGPQ